LAVRVAKIKGESDRTYTDGYLEIIAVHRKLATEMLWRDILLFHGSAVAVDGQVYLFTAKSGTGKSTHARLWRQKFGERAVMVNDDKPMLKVYENGVGVCGTPWNGKHHLDTNTELPLKAICIIHQDRENHIERISPYEAIPALWLQAYRRVEAMDTEKILQLLGRIAEHVPLYRMGCNMDPEAADVAWKGMHG
jgi:serine kinase of HPr protein (carbohydrate metabolism regulator)